ncbi:glycoside hydrolase family 28 protein [Thalassobellus suaedae]|uniref:Glycosyl hydrolase family 28-related protein n=1 Tax=Thalassobellus suaedae TaxID=3074124 RepID=A0ABY9XT82_9FLAO|nr:glycosyl hydrolase family 28-related protein [Flavobacteriaceae bacterium HL-DH14]
MKLDTKKALNLLLCIAIFSITLNSCKDKVKEEKITEIDPFDTADEIISKIKKLEFPDNTINIVDLGAIADGKTLNTQAIKKAIDSCNKSGGGKVIIPSGNFLTGPIVLKSNVNLHLEEGANVLFTTDKSAYLPTVHTSYEAVELMNYSPLIYAYKQNNIAVTGKGTFNGQADRENWWISMVWCRTLWVHRRNSKAKRRP